MTKYIYNSSGSAVGFISGKYIYDIRGHAVGQLNGTHVHKLSGHYVGELHKDMVVDKQLGHSNISPSNPSKIESLGNPVRRGSVNCGYPDVFDKLLK